MSSIERPLKGDVLVFDLEAERARTSDPAITERSGRNARTLMKSGPLRVTLIVLAPGGGIPEHHAEGPILVQPLDGRIVLTIAGETHDLGPGQLLSAGPGVPHSVRSEAGASFLLTVSQPPAA